MPLDQAENLRRLVEQKKGNFSRILKHTICITSGKGGVGKSNIALNLGIVLSKLNKKVLLFDGDISLANLNILLGVSPDYNIYNLIKGDKNINDVIFQTQYKGLDLLPGSSGIKEITNLMDYEIDRLKSQLQLLEDKYDYIIVDTAAGISNIVMGFVLSSDMVLLVVTPETTSITDAYALLKISVNEKRDINVKIIMNMVDSKKHGKEAFNKFNLLSKKFLNKELELYGIIEKEKKVSEAVIIQTPIIEYAPNSSFAYAIKNIANLIVKGIKPQEEKDSSFVEKFLEKMKNFNIYK